MKPIEGQHYQYDVCLSFAGEQRPYAEQVASELRRLHVRVFYDDFEKANLWGKNLYDHLDWVYRQAAQFCVFLISADYGQKLWTSHERKSAQERAFREKGEYILPARFDATEIPGLLSTVGSIDLSATTPRKLALLIVQKLAPLPGQPCRGWLERPDDGDTIGSCPEIRGRVIGLSPRYDLWVAHRRGPGGAFWPKEPMIDLGPDGNFELSVIEEGAPGTVVVSLLMVPALRSRDFADWLQRGHSTHFYPGISSTDADVELASVSVRYHPGSR